MSSADPTHQQALNDYNAAYSALVVVLTQQQVATEAYVRAKRRLGSLVTPDNVPEDVPRQLRIGDTVVEASRISHGQYHVTLHIGLPLSVKLNVQP